MIYKVCDQTDCPLHKDYTLKQKDSVFPAHDHNQTGDWFSINPSNNMTSRLSYDTNEIDFSGGIIFKTRDIECHIECLFCIHKKDFNMKAEVLSRMAQDLLKGE